MPVRFRGIENRYARGQCSNHCLLNNDELLIFWLRGATEFFKPGTRIVTTPAKRVGCRHIGFGVVRGCADVLRWTVAYVEPAWAAQPAQEITLEARWLLHAACTPSDICGVRLCAYWPRILNRKEQALAFPWPYLPCLALPCLACLALPFALPRLALPLLRLP